MGGGASQMARADRVPDPPREFRAAWIASVHNIDWPSRPGLSAGQQQAELRKLLDLAVSLNLNAVIFQVRPGCDALYESRKEPWSYWLTGTEGRSPGYDPLAFAIAEAHARGLELHAWFNPFRASPTPKISHARSHVTRERSSAIRSYGQYKWLDPGDAWARQYSIDVMLDVTRRYDIDGVHIDDYFYPYPSSHRPGEPPSPPFPDDSTYASYRKSGGRLGRDDWRRHNIDTFVRDLYGSIKKAKPWVKFGISPFGIWRPGVPSGIEAGLDAHDHLYADSRVWLRNGWCDYFTPQLYWRIEPRKQSFSTLLDWWDSENQKRRHLWPGIASSRIKSSDDPGRPASETTAQIDATRRLTKRSAPGHIHWSIDALRDNRGGVNRLLTSQSYPGKALVPDSPWLGRLRLEEPDVRRTGSGITWEPGGDPRGVRWWAIQVREGGAWRLAAILPAKARDLNLGGRPDAVAVRAVGPYGAVSDAGEAK